MESISDLRMLPGPVGGELLTAQTFKLLINLIFLGTVEFACLLVYMSAFLVFAIVTAVSWDNFRALLCCRVQVMDEAGEVFFSIGRRFS
ncbi:unnamed protein product [Toxocara canis]|uniref:Inner membrane protein n=1 Tax=Toxocara canis TaxID=6265 RepID=A0A183U7P5_TOXCA|nr:unnamed protein product [Toxocara canis]